ncbi:hypothetical protein [Stenotrophomonas rhizophila]|uniref:hypothetical protein n=1 Tax=Stenotrophomonas rhizophila TaxID=216778 RepID=UPI0010BF8C45|nr:hypothetical protein [Stenotrophomonas rhizophila]
MRFTAAAGSLVVLLTVSSTVSVSAAETDIFGIKLGAQLTLPVCELSSPAPAARRSNIGLGARAFNKLTTPPPEPLKAMPPSTGLCVAPGTTNMAVGNTEFGPGEYGYLVFATAEAPAWVAPIGMGIGAGAGDAFSLEGAGGLVLLRNGRVIALRFNTTGFEAEPRVMELLKRKFGSPGSQRAVTWNNDLGGSRDSISAQWRKPDFFADYSSVVQTQAMRAQGLSGGIGFLNIGNELGQQVLQPAASKEAEF